MKRIRVEEIDGIIYIDGIDIMKNGVFSLEYDKETLKDMVLQLQEENERLKNINNEYERLNKEKYRGFKIINVQQYNIDELLSYKKYKDNWNKLREWIVYNKHNENTEQHYLVVDYGTLLGKMAELERSDSDE